MPSLERLLAAGLEAQDWRETATRSPDWRRFAKFGRGAMYVLHPPTKANSLLWFSEIAETEPALPVVGPIYDQLLLAGDKWLKDQSLDTEALLIELLYAGDEAAGNNKNDDGD